MLRERPPFSYSGAPTQRAAPCPVSDASRSAPSAVPELTLLLDQPVHETWRRSGRLLAA